jgi:molybdate transport system substrate-binding protein
MLLRALLTGLAAVLLPAPAGAQRPATVAAASDLRFALDEVIIAFERETSLRVRVTYGSSGDIARQIEQGAPFDLFLSADESYVARLAAKGLTVDGGVLYGIGRLVAFAPAGSPVQVDEALADLGRAAGDGRLRRLAIANPEHAPYGRAAREVLESLGLWSAVERKLVFGENVSQAAQFAASGSAEAGLFALSLAISPGLAGKGRYVVLPDKLHRPLRQRMVLLKRGSPGAGRLYDFLQQPAARAILKRYGFSVPAN